MRNVLFLLLLFPWPALAGNLPVYTEHQKLFREYEKLESLVFEGLTFSPASIEVQKGINFKFVVRDQLGDLWLFKGGLAARDGAVAMYRFFNL